MKQLIYEFYGPSGLTKSKNISNSSRLVIEEAERLGIKWQIVPCTQLVRLTYKGRIETYYHQVPASTTALAKFCCNNKKITTNLLYQNDISVPKGYRIKKDSSNQYLRSAFDNLKKPLVVKPSDGTWGEGITLNITNYTHFIDAIDLAFAFSSRKKKMVIVEEMFQGYEYRILLTREKVIGVLHRRPASVVGNGVDSIRQLIKTKNKNPIRGPKNGSTSHLNIRMDAHMSKLLAEKNLDFSSVVPKGKRVFLRRVSNISQGGDAIDVTDVVHPTVKEIALKAIRTIHGLSFAGIDFITRNIKLPQTKQSYTIIEINDSPGFDIHDFPYEGKNRHAAREFISLMFPELAEGG